MQANQANDSHALALAAGFENLKTRLLLECLNETPESETHALIIRQASEAALLARQSEYPLLTFPCLFAEKALAAIAEARRQARHYWSSLQPPAPTRTVPAGLAPRRSAHGQRGAAPESLDPGSYLILMRQHHGKTCRPRLPLAARAAMA
jgi:hypothetical protein